MGEQSKIEWCDHTFNPWEGCQKVGPGCDHCYAETRNARFAGGMAINWGPGAPRRRTREANWRKPLSWNANHEAFFADHGHRQRVFCASLADVFDNQVDPQWRVDLFELIRATPNLDWLLLTKRIGNVGNMLPVPFDFDKHYPNVWIGATIVNQQEADRDIPKLLAVPARVRFLSMEPLLGPVKLTSAGRIPSDDEGPARIGFMVGPDDGKSGLWVTPADALKKSGIDWVIVGGESGPGARPMHPEWARSLRDQCEAAGVPFLFKQWGEWLPAKEGRSITGRTLVLEGSAPFADNPQWYGFEDGQQLARVGKKAAGRLLDGRTWDGVPMP